MAGTHCVTLTPRGGALLPPQVSTGESSLLLHCSRRARSSVRSGSCLSITLRSSACCPPHNTGAHILHGSLPSQQACCSSSGARIISARRVGARGCLRVHCCWVVYAS